MAWKIKDKIYRPFRGDDKEFGPLDDGAQLPPVEQKIQSITLDLFPSLSFP